MQKRVVGLFIFLMIGVFISVNFASAALVPKCNITSYTDYQTFHNADPAYSIMMGLSSASNAHGDTPWNYTNPTYSPGGDEYPYVVMCNFGGGNRTCSINSYNSRYLPLGIQVPINKVIGLTQINPSDIQNTTNAHAEVPQNTNYPVNVCYWGLECINVTGSACPMGNPKQTYSLNPFNLSADTNAHIGTGTGFTTSICCKYLGSNAYIAPSCNLTSATWTIANATQGQKVGLNITGTNCNGATVSFNVTTAGKKPASALWGINDMPFPATGNNMYVEWTAPYDSKLSLPNEYEANVSITGVTSIETGYIKVNNVPQLDTNKKDNFNATVATWPNTNYCTTISVCSDYKDALNCNSDTCNRAINEPKYNPNAYSSGCEWNTAKNVCQFVSVSQAAGAVTCGSGTTLCQDSSSSIQYCYPGNTCPTGSFVPTNNNGLCGLGDGCLSADCQVGNQDSCVKGATCNANGECFNASQPLTSATQCGNDYTLCSNTQAKLNYCFPGAKCPGNDVPAVASCAKTDGSADASITCYAGLSCNAVSGGGYCYSSTIPIGKCVYGSNTPSSNTCSADGLLSYSWTASWSGTTAQPNACQSGSDVVDCPSSIPLPFFNVYNVIATVIVLGLIYVAVILAKKKKPAKKGKAKKTISHRHKKK